MEVRDLLKLAQISVDGDDAKTTTWPDITKLDLSNQGLSELPPDLPTALPNLSVLFLSNNKFTELPAIIGQCPNLQMIAFKSNQMTSIHPDALHSQLRWLILTDNLLLELPDSLGGNCRRLQKLMLSGNRLTAIPKSISNCRNLELVRLASNRLTEPPMELLSLPSLRWVALSDNPFLEEIMTLPKLPTLEVLHDLDESEEGTILGQGAGGVTKKLTYQSEPVAIKIFSNSMTSDGLPAMERRILSVVSGLNSSGFVALLGQSKSGYSVTEFLDNYRAFGGPPSMESCSRDVYESEQKLSLEHATNLITVLLEALYQLHSMGITHGDFYGHNILVSHDLNNVKLSDFGAAFFYDTNTAYGTLIEKIELRAFGVLVSEVLLQLDTPTKDEDEAVSVEAYKKRLQQLVDLCYQEESTFESVSIWLKQRALSDMANAFDVTDEKD